jgi:hypothetical protein
MKWHKFVTVNGLTNRDCSEKRFASNEAAGGKKL